MRKFLREKLNIKGRKTLPTSELSNGGHEPSDKTAEPQMKRVKKVVRRQAILAGGTLIIAVILIFAMTSAWYTNVSKVSSLTFKAEAWGFDPEKIEVSDTEVVVAPGTSGVVPLQIDNSESRDSVKIYVTASKLQMNAGLRNRIFFFADTAEVSNGETMSRIYLGSTDDNAFSYTLMPGQKLILSDDYYSDVPVKWEWVYDMVGYYFRGTVTEENNVIIDEYLRPISYDLDSATFDLYGENPTGQLLTVGGDSLEDFLADVASTDGYEGTINPENAVTKGTNNYYPVQVDGDGHGVWAYLCNYNEIQNGISFDTALSNELDDIVATFNVTAVNLPSRVEVVSTVSELTSALEDENVEVVELAGNMELESAVRLTDGTAATLDLNGYSLTYTGTGETYSLIRALGGSSLTVMNGEINGNGGVSGVEGRVSSVAFDAVCADLTLSNVKVRGFDTAVYVADNGGAGTDSVVKLYNCDLETENPTVLVLGNGDVSSAPTQVIIQGCTINSTTHSGISGNGSSDRYGTDIVVIDSKVSGKYTSIYQPQQNSTLLVSNSELEGITGIAVKGGTVNIIDSKVKGTGPYTAPRAAGSGWTDTGDGIYVEAVYNWGVSVTVKGDSEVTSANGYAVDLFGRAGSGVGRIILQDGEYRGALGAVTWNEIGSVQIYGGTFTGTVSESVTRYDNTEPGE